MKLKMGLPLRMWNSILLVAVVIFLAPFAQGQQQPGQTPTLKARPADPNAPAPRYPDLASIHVQSTLVQAPVTVVDPSGQFVQSLAKNDFRILDNGVPQHIAKFSLAMEPVALVVVVQTNQAVAPMLDQVQPLGSLFSGLLVGKKGEAALVCFDDTVRVAQDFANDPAKLGQTLHHIKAEGNKARLNDALGRAILMLANRPTAERRVIVVFSEGSDKGSETSRQEIVRAATGAGVAIYGLHFSPTQALLTNQAEPNRPNPLANNLALPAPPGRPQTPTAMQVYNSAPVPGGPVLSGARDALGSLFGKNLVEIYAAYTGGVTYSHWKANKLQKQLTRVALEVNSQYMLAYTPNTLKQPGFHRLQIEVLPPRLKVRARAGYFIQ